MVVLEGAAAGIALRLPAAVGHTRDEIVERVEGQLAAIAAIEKAIYKGAEELVTESPAVPPSDEAHVIEELPVGVYAPARDGSVGAQRRKAAHHDLWQAEILRGRPHIQPDGRWIEAAILREKRFVEAVVTAAQLHQQPWSEDFGIGNRNDIHIGRRDRVEAR